MRSMARTWTSFGSDQGHGPAAAVRAARAADAVGVVLGRVRHVEIDHMRHAGAIDAAGRDVRGDHDAVTPGAEAFEGFLAAVLGQVALQGRGRHALLLQLAGQTLGAVLGAGEDEHAVVAFRAEIGFEQGHLLGGLDGVDAVADLFRRRRVGHLHHRGLH